MCKRCSPEQFNVNVHSLCASAMLEATYRLILRIFVNGKIKALGEIPNAILFRHLLSKPFNFFVLQKRFVHSFPSAQYIENLRKYREE